MLPKLIEHRFMNRIFYALSGPRRVLPGWVRVPGRGPTPAYGLLRGIHWFYSRWRTHSELSPSRSGQYGLLLGVTLAGISLFVLQGPMRPWLGSLSFTVDLMVRTAIYAAVIVPIQFFQLGDTRSVS